MIRSLAYRLLAGSAGMLLGLGAAAVTPSNLLGSGGSQCTGNFYPICETVWPQECPDSQTQNGACFNACGEGWAAVESDCQVGGFPCFGGQVRIYCHKP